MGSFKSTILTKKAHNLMAKLTAGTADMQFTKICSSEYDYSQLNSAELEALTEIQYIKQEVSVSEVKIINDSSVKVHGVLVNSELTEGYYIKTIALYASDPDEGEILYSVTPSTLSDWMPPNNGITSSSALIDLITVVSNAENVNIDVDPSAVVSISQFNEFKEQVAEQMSEMTNRFKNAKGKYTSLTTTQKGNLIKVCDLPHNFINIKDYVVNAGATKEFLSDGTIKITPNGVYSGIILSYICTLKTNTNAYISFYGKADSTRQITLWDGEKRNDINYLTTEWQRFVIPIKYLKQSFSFFSNIETNTTPFYIKNIQIDIADKGYVDYGNYKIISSTVGYNKNKSNLFVTSTDIGYSTTNLKPNTKYCFDSNGRAYAKVQVVNNDNVVTTYGGTVSDTMVYFITPSNVKKITCWYKSSLSNMTVNTDILDSDLKGVELYEVLNFDIVEISDNINATYLKTFDDTTIISSDIDVTIVYSTNDIDNDLLLNNSSFSEIIHPNLLINGDFQVWQRGTSFTAVDNGKYVADRWRADNNISSALTVSKGTNGLTMTWVASSNGTLSYHMEENDKTKLIGKKVTCSISIDNIIYTGMVTIINSYTYITFDLNKKMFSTNTSASSTTILLSIYHVGAPSGTTYTINYCKLELGSIATPFVSRLYAEEVSLCKRYYQKINTLGNPYPTIGMVATIANLTNCYLEIPLSVPLRTMPTCTLKGNITLFSTTNSLTYSTIESITASFVKIACTLGTVLTTTGVQMCEGKNDTNADVLLDSEIYS